ncbi:12547_t:CDS:1 [Funneliformis geosporum]|nr:12547_t:CDS:1 [Funneliformis geosporum]
MKTGILLSKGNKSDKEDNYEEDDVIAIIKLIQKEDQKDLKDTIRKLLFDNLLSVLDYINADKINSDNCFLLDNKIVEIVRLNPNADDEKEIIPVIFLTKALVNVEKLINLYNFSLKIF